MPAVSIARLHSGGDRCRLTLLSFERLCRLVEDDRTVYSMGAESVVHLENSIAAVKRVLSNQENKGTRWMPWRQEPMKDVGGCDKPREGADHPLIRGFPNGETYAW
jgi:hypothetical protein